MSEIENLAARQGEEEARRHQALQEEIDILQNQIRKTQKFDSYLGKCENRWLVVCTIQCYSSN